MRRAGLCAAACLLLRAVRAADAAASGHRVRDHAAPRNRGHRGALVLGDSTTIFAVPKLAARGLPATRRSAASSRARPDRVLLIDRRASSAGASGWFAADGLHVNDAGARAYARLIARRAAGVIAPPTSGGLRRLCRLRRGLHPVDARVVRRQDGGSSPRPTRAHGGGVTLVP